MIPPMLFTSIPYLYIILYKDSLIESIGHRVLISLDLWNIMIKKNSCCGRGQTLPELVCLRQKTLISTRENSRTSVPPAHGDLFPSGCALITYQVSGDRHTCAFFFRRRKNSPCQAVFFPDVACILIFFLSLGTLYVTFPSEQQLVGFIHFLSLVYFKTEH